MFLQGDTYDTGNCISKDSETLDEQKQRCLGPNMFGGAIQKGYPRHSAHRMRVTYVRLRILKVAYRRTTRGVRGDLCAGDVAVIHRRSESIFQEPTAFVLVR